MGSEREGYRENNIIVANAAANSRNINRRGRVRTTSRPSYIGIVWESYDEGIKVRGGPNRKAVSGKR